MHREDYPGTWEILLSPSKGTGRGTADKNPGQSEAALAERRVRHEGAQGRYRRASQRAPGWRQEVGASRVPVSQGNRPPKDPEEGRGRQGIEPVEGKMARMMEFGTVSTRLRRIAELARKAPEMVIVTLAHHIDLEWLYEAYSRTRKDGAAGDRRSMAAEYAKDLGENLRSLLEASSRERTLHHR